MSTGRNTNNRRRGSPVIDDLQVRAGLLHGGVGVWCWDMRSDRVTWSENIEAIHRVPKGTMDGTFESFRRDIHPADRGKVLRAIDKALQNGGSYAIEYRLPSVKGQQDRWIEARGSVIYEAGRPVSMIGICQDVSHRKRAEIEDERRARLQEQVASLGQRSLSERRLDGLLNDAAETVASALSLEFVKILQSTADDDRLLLTAGVGWAPGTIGHATVATDPKYQSGYTLLAGKPVLVQDFSKERRFEPPPLLVEHGVKSGLTTVIAAPDGGVYGILGAYGSVPRGFDSQDILFLQSVANIIANAITTHYQREQQELLIRELYHRSGNLLAIVQSLFTRTAVQARSFKDFRDKFFARFMSVASAHALIIDNGWRTVPVASLLHRLMGESGDNIESGGDRTRLPADDAFALSMVIHELATNARTHGALAAPE